MNTLSLFDGMSCAQIALGRAGIHCDNYFASELDKFAIKVTQANYPKTQQIGDVCAVKAGTLPKINLLIGGSPCQGFSSAGKRLNFDDPRSKLFFEYVRILNEIREINPDVKFLLENVRMKKESRDIISEHLGVEPVEICSSLVSAQMRKRLYWTNWEFGQPDDRGTMLKDILSSGFTDRDKSFCVDANYHKGGNLNQYFNKSRRQVVFIRGLDQHRWIPGDKSRCFKQRGRVYHVSGKSPTLITTPSDLPKISRSPDGTEYRKLTTLECERLQTVPDNYTNHVSNTQRYKMLGNGMTVDVIAHILDSSGL